MLGDFRIGERLVRVRLNAIEDHDQTLHVEPKVMQVLLLLAEHAGDVVTREMIRQAVWPNTFVGDDVLVRAISELRRAFHDSPRAQHTIETIPKVGYRLVTPIIRSVEEVLPEAVEPVDQSPATPATAASATAPVQAMDDKDATVMALPLGWNWKPLLPLGLVIVLLGFAALYWRPAHTPVVPGAVTAPTPAPQPASAPAAEAAVAAPHESCPLVSGATYEITNKQTGSLLEVPAWSATNGTLIDQWKRNNGANQRWILDANGPYWTFTNVSSRKMLDVPRASRNSGTQVDQWVNNHGTNQNWILLPVGDKSCKIISQVSGLLLDVSKSSTGDGTPIIQFVDNDGANQHWVFRLVQPPAAKSN